MFHVSSHSRPWEGGWLDGCSALRQYRESSAAPLHDGGLWTRRLFIGYWPLISGHWIFLWSDAAADTVISLPSLQLCVFSVLWAANIHSHDQSPDTCQQCLNSDRECWLQCIFGYSEVLTLLWLSCAHIKFYLSKSCFSAWKVFLCVIYRQSSTILTQLKRNFVIIFLFMRWNMWAADVQSSRGPTCEARC